MKPEYLINNMQAADKKKGVTLVITFSRRIFAPIFFKSFNQMQLPRENIHLLVYDNTEDTLLADVLRNELTGLIPLFRSVRLYKSYLKGKGSIMGSGNEQFKKSKLFNIWAMWKSIFITRGGMIFTPEFFYLEDDTIACPDAYNRLFAQLHKDSKVGMVTGIETGRHAYPWVPVRLGVHYLKMRKFKVLERISLDPNLKGLQKIDASGVYCFAARTKAYKTGFLGYDPCSLKIPFFAMDNVMTWNMKLHGWGLLADFNVWCSHLEASAARIISFSKDQAVPMADIWIEKFNNYASGVEIFKRNQKARRFRVTKPAPSWELDPDKEEDL